MVRTIRWTIALVVSVGMLVPAHAQVGMDDGGEAHGEVHFIWAMPRGELGDHVSQRGLGVSALIGGRVPGWPVVLGTEVGALGYGTDNLLEVSGSQLPVSVLNVQAQRSMLMGHMMARLQPSSGALRPYVDVLLGVRHFGSRVSAEGDAVVAEDGDVIIVGSRAALDDGFATAAQFSDAVLSYGVGGGLDLRLIDEPLGLCTRATTVTLNVGVRYLFGEEAEYLRQDPIQRDDETVVLDVGRSRTDMLVPQVGLSVTM